MRYGLDEKIIEELCSVFRKFGNIDEVRIFGSRAKGNYHEGSDIDLAVYSDSLTFNQRMEIQSLIDELMLLYKVDIVDYRKKASTPIGEHIARVSMPFYVRS